MEVGLMGQPFSKYPKSSRNLDNGLGLYRATLKMMAATRTGIVVQFGPRTVLSGLSLRRSPVPYPKPGLSRKFFVSLAICFPVTCMLWTAIIYGALRLAR
jgi:hypothetical protein